MQNQFGISMHLNSLESRSLIDCCKKQLDKPKCNFQGKWNNWFAKQPPHSISSLQITLQRLINIDPLSTITKEIIFSFSSMNDIFSSPKKVGKGFHTILPIFEWGTSKQCSLPIIKSTQHPCTSLPNPPRASAPFFPCVDHRK